MSEKEQQNNLEEFNTYDIISIIFKDPKGKEHLLTKDTQEVWKKTFALNSIDDIFTASIPQELRQKLGKDIQIKKGSLFKIVAQGRENFIPQIKEVLESPDFAINDGNLLLGKHLRDNDYFVNVSVDKGEYFISISNGIKEFNNIQNKIKNGASIIYQSPNANSILQTLLQASLYSANKIDNKIIPNTAPKSQGENQILAENVINYNKDDGGVALQSIKELEITRQENLQSMKKLIDAFKDTNKPKGPRL